MLSVAQCKKLLSAGLFSDEEAQDLVNELYQVATILVEAHLSAKGNHHEQSKTDRSEPRVVRGFFLEAAELSNKKVEKESYNPTIEGDVIEELEKFQRYKTATVNLILKTQHELERLSRLKRGDSVPTTLAVGVNVGTN